MKNSEIIANAKKVIESAQRQGFKKASLQLIDGDDNNFSSVDDYVYDYSEEGESTLSVTIKLADLTLDISRDPEDDDADPIVTYPE